MEFILRIQEVREVRSRGLVLCSESKQTYKDSFINLNTMFAWRKKNL